MIYKNIINSYGKPQIEDMSTSYDQTKKGLFLLIYEEFLHVNSLFNLIEK